VKDRTPTGPVWALRAGAIAVLAALLVVGIPAGERVPDDRLALPRELRVAGPEIAGDAADPDARAERWDELLRQAAEAPLVATVSGAPPPFVLLPPHRLRAGRPTALGITAFESMRPTVVSPAGIEETLDLKAGETDAFVLRPRAEGWATWRLSPDPDGTGGEVPWTAWVEPARPLRMLALSGPPTPESRLALRALEEAGEEVEAWIHLGRDLWIGREPGPLPDEPSAYEDFDAVLLFPGLALPEETASALESAVRDGGRGLLLAGTDGGSTALVPRGLGSLRAGGWSGSGAVRADALRWRLPPEVEPLPPADLSVRLLDGVGPEEAGLGVPLELAAHGRGRIGALALVDTWRWRMEGGFEGEHRAFWRSTVEWLAGGLVADPALEPLGDAHRAGAAVRVRWVEKGGEAQTADDRPGIAGIRVTGPGGEERVLELPAVRDTSVGAVGLGTFVPFETGAYVLVPLGPDGEAREPGIGISASGWEQAPLDPEGALGRLALASPGGRIDAAGALPDPAAPLRTGDPTVLRAALLFTLLAGLLGTEWALRRLRGRP
jgi:hypothetical protein